MTDKLKLILIFKKSSLLHLASYAFYFKIIKALGKSIVFE